MSEVSDKEFGGGILGSPMGKSGVAVAFSESFSVGADDERDVDPVCWSLPLECLVDGELAVGAKDQVVSSGDLVDFLVVVIGDDGELVGGRSVVASDDEVPELGVWRQALGTCEGIGPKDR